MIKIKKFVSEIIQFIVFYPANIWVPMLHVEGQKTPFVLGSQEVVQVWRSFGDGVKQSLWSYERELRDPWVLREGNQPPSRAVALNLSNAVIL